MVEIATSEEDREFIRRIESDPVFRWSRKRFGRDGQPPAGGAKEAWALQQSIALRLALGRMAVHDLSSSMIGPHLLARTILGASTLSWSREIFEAAIDADYEGAVFGELEEQPSASFWVLDDVVDKTAISILAFALIPDRSDRMLVAPIGGPVAGFNPVPVYYGTTREQHMRHWTAIADQTNGHFMLDFADLAYRTIVLGSAFLASPYIPKQVETVGKPRRKDPVNVRRHARPRDVTVVNLRRAMTQNGDAGPDIGATDAERRSYSRRWVVSGHFRNQAHGPGHSLRKLIWIPPYIKGPDDVPIGKTVYRAIR